MTFSQMISNLVGPGRSMTRACWTNGRHIYYGHIPTDKKKKYTVVVEVSNGTKPRIYKPNRNDLNAKDWEVV